MRGPLCAGIDPSAELLYRWDLPDDSGGLARFCDSCLEGLADVVPVVKPQVAFFERHGAAGMEVLEGFLAAARRSGLLVIADAKRGDIASTARAYGDAWLDPESPLAADAVTAVPYLGLGSLEPMFQAAQRHARAVLVVVRSSNPEGRWLQEARLVARDGSVRTVEDALLAEIATINARCLVGHPERKIGSVGAVVGATLEPSGFPLESLRGAVLAPGVGTQGAGTAELRRLFANCPAGTVLASASRSLLAAGPDPASLRRAAVRARDLAAAALG